MYFLKVCTHFMKQSVLKIISKFSFKDHVIKDLAFRS